MTKGDEILLDDDEKSNVEISWECRVSTFNLQVIMCLKCKDRHTGDHGVFRSIKFNDILHLSVSHIVRYGARHAKALRTSIDHSVSVAATARAGSGSSSLGACACIDSEEHSRIWKLRGH
eukprot:6182710-Pleurochrysis_carterae.AAC.2